MQPLLKLSYLILFCSLDILLYLRLGKNIVKATYWLIIAAIIWLIFLIIHLQVFKLTYLMPLKDFITLSGIIIPLLIIYYIGMFAIRVTERTPMVDDMKQFVIKVMSITFNTVIFAVFLLVHIIFILSWPG